MAGKLRFISDGVHEIGRMFQRRKLRNRLVALDKQRKEALSQLGRRSWEAKVDLTGYGNLADQLHRLDEKAGQLTARTSELQAQSDSLQSRRAAEVSRFDQLSKPVLEKKTQADAALRAGRSKLSDSERTIGSLQGRLKFLTDELARGGQATSAQMVAEQKSVSDQLAAAAPMREALAAEVNRLTVESQQLGQEVARIEAERKAGLAPIDAELQRVKQESQGASREISNVGREQTDRLTELGAALYGQKVRHPALEDCTQAVDAVDKNRAESQAALDASLALTGAMPRWTMLKFAGIPLFLVGIMLGAILAIYLFSGESSESGPLQYFARQMTRSGTSEVADRSALSDELRKDRLVRAFLDSRGEESRREAVQILENDITTIGSTADRVYLPYLTKILRRGEPELRAAAGHSIGMIGPAASEVAVLLEALNDPVPGVREGALAALQQVRDDARIRLLVRRVQAGARSGARRNRELFRPEGAPDSQTLGVPIFEGATFLHYASDPEVGRTSFVTDAPVQTVVDFYRSRAGRPPLPADEFARTYLGATPQDPTGGKRLASESEAWLKQAVQAGKSEAEIRAQMDRNGARMMNLPHARYMDTELYGTPTFVALEGAVPAGRTIRYVAVFEDRALGKTGFEVYVPR